MKYNCNSIKVNDNLWLVNQSFKTKQLKKVEEVPTNHVVVLDCSGSMSSDLPEIRTQLKKKLPKLIGVKDTLSIIWFSGKGQFGVLLEAEPISTLVDLNQVEKSIDRWLQPVGLTGFKEPLEETKNLVARVLAKNPGSVFSLFFLSDGCDNQWSKSEILKTVESISPGFSASTFVEYGYYADRPLLTAMAEKSGGSFIHASAFDKFQPIFEASMAKRLTAEPKVEVDINSDVIGGFAWSCSDDKEILTHSIENQKVIVQNGVDSIYYLSSTAAVGDKFDHGSLVPKPLKSAMYAAMSLFSTRMRPDIVLPILKTTGDVKFIDDFSSCFGKQMYSEFMDNAKKASFDESLQLTKGYDPNKVPDDDAFTVLDILKILSSDNDNKLMLDDPSFSYSRIGRSRVDASENLSTEEFNEVSNLTSQLVGEKKVSKIKEIHDKIDAILSKKKGGFVFKQDESNGYPISSLTFNEDRPNVSVLVRKPGTVDISLLAPPSVLESVPSKFPTFIYRNYSIIRDGLVNVSKLPVTLSSTTRSHLLKLFKSGHIPNDAIVFNDDSVDTINLDRLPVINRKMVKEVSAISLFKKEYDLVLARAEQKVLNSYKKEFFPKTNADYSVMYGADSALWLKENGFTDNSGFSPKTVLGQSTDFYLGKELVVSMKGLSSLPSVKDVKAGMEKGKLNHPGFIMSNTVNFVNKFLSSEGYLKSDKKDALFEKFLDFHSDNATNKVRGLIFELAQIKFSIIVGQIWFKEFDSLDVNTLSVDFDAFGRKDTVVCKVELKEVQVNI